MASVRGLTPEAIKALIEDSKRDYKVVRESLTTMHRRYEAFDADLDHLSRRMDNLPDELQESLDSLVNLDAVLEEAKAEVDSLRRRFPIKEVDIADGAITANKIEAGSITTLQLAAGAVTTEKLAAGAVTAKKIDSKAVTAEKLAADSVTAGSIAADSVLTRHIGTEQVTAEKLKAGAVEADKIAAGAVTADSIAAGAVTADSIEAGAIQMKPDSIFSTVGGANIPRDESRTYTNPAVGVSKTLTGFHPKTTYTIPFKDSDSVALYSDGKYTLSGITGISRIEPNRHHYIYINIVCDKVGGKEVIAEVTGTKNCESAILSYWQDDVDPNTTDIKFSVRPLYGDRDALDWSVDFEVYHETANAVKVREIRLSVRYEFGEHFISAIDILAPPVTARDISTANRRIELFSQSLEESVRALSRKTVDLETKLSKSERASKAFLLVKGSRDQHNGIAISDSLVGKERRYVLDGSSSPYPVMYQSLVALSYKSKLSDVVWSGAISPRGRANIAPYVEGVPVSAVVEPLGGVISEGEYRRTDFNEYGLWLLSFPGFDPQRTKTARISASLQTVVKRVGERNNLGAVEAVIRVQRRDSKTNKVLRTEDLDSYYVKAGLFGTERYDVEYNLSYDGEYPLPLPAPSGTKDNFQYGFSIGPDPMRADYRNSVVTGGFVIY